MMKLLSRLLFILLIAVPASGLFAVNADNYLKGLKSVDLVIENNTEVVTYEQIRDLVSKYCSVNPNSVNRLIIRVRSINDETSFLGMVEIYLARRGCYLVNDSRDWDNAQAADKVYENILVYSNAAVISGKYDLAEMEAKFIEAYTVLIKTLFDVD